MSTKGEPLSKDGQSPLIVPARLIPGEMNVWVPMQAGFVTGLLFVAAWHVMRRGIKKA